MSHERVQMARYSPVLLKCAVVALFGSQDVVRQGGHRAGFINAHGEDEAVK